MKIWIISDLHEDIIRTKEAIQILKDNECKKIICLWDFIGYSAPYYWYFASRNWSAVIDELKKNCDTVVVWNHDLFWIKKLPKYSSFKYPENWLELDYKTQEKISNGILIFEENNELPSLISHEEEEYMSNLPEFIIEEIDGIRILFSHRLYPDFSWSEMNFKIETLEYKQHFEFMKENNCQFSFIGHAHNKQRLFTNNWISYIDFNNKTIMPEGTWFVVPCVAKTTFENWVTIFDTETREIEMIPLHSDIHIVPDRAKE